MHDYPDYAKCISELPEFLSIQSLSENIGSLIRRGHIFEFDGTVLDFFTDPMMSHFNMFGSSVKDGIFHQSDSGLIINQ